MAKAKTTVRYKAIPDFPGYYVGDDGSVWSQRKQIRLSHGYGTYAVIEGPWKKLKATPTSNGYLCVLLMPKRRWALVHQLVLETFVGPCPKGMESRHFPDRDKTNNKLSNLQWATMKVNQADRIAHDTHNRGERNNTTKLTEDQVRSIRVEYKQLRGSRKKIANGGLTAMASRYGVTRDAIQRIMSGTSWHWLS